MPKHITKRQREAIRGYVSEGYSANRIQIKLREQHMGIRRKSLLTQIRKVKGQKPKAETVKYIPKKYAKARWRARAKTHYIRKRLKPWEFKPRKITITGMHYGKKVIKEYDGSGKELYSIVKNEMEKVVKKEMTGGYWDARPSVES